MLEVFLPEVVLVAQEEFQLVVVLQLKTETLRVAAAAAEQTRHKTAETEHPEE
jgi:hypothetical protein